MALRGDAVKSETYFKPEPSGNYFANDLVQQISGMNKRRNQEEIQEKSHHTEFCIGVAGYPEKHMEAANIAQNIRRLKHNVNAGAENVATQIYFDNEHY